MVSSVQYKLLLYADDSCLIVSNKDKILDLDRIICFLNMFCFYLNVFELYLEYLNFPNKPN